MAKQKTENSNVATPAPSASTGGEKCAYVECKKGSTRAQFCAEHFVWFKEGLITAKGQRPTDFDKKMFDYQKRSTKKSA